jgi:hypothetical protein
MFLLDSLMISGIRWAIETVVTAAEAEMNDDTVLREQLLEAEMRREMGEISDDEFAGIEGDLLARIREIKERREGGSGPLAFGEGEPIEALPDSRFEVVASVEGDFYGDAPGRLPASEHTGDAPAPSVTPKRAKAAAQTRVRRARAARTTRRARAKPAIPARTKPRT